MAKILIVGDSQSVNPGAVARRALQDHGHTVNMVSNTGRGPYDYVRIPSLWAQYTNAVTTFHPDIVLLIFGHNDSPNENLRNALARMKSSVTPKVLLTGPPLYIDPAAQRDGEAVKAIHASVFGTDFFDAYPYTATTLEHQAPTPTFPNGNPHFTLAGARPWGTAIAAEIERRLAGSSGGGGGGTTLGPR